jgi:hypothetical protein
MDNATSSLSDGISRWHKRERSDSIREEIFVIHTNCSDALLFAIFPQLCITVQNIVPNVLSEKGYS